MRPLLYLINMVQIRDEGGSRSVMNSHDRAAKCEGETIHTTLKPVAPIILLIYDGKLIHLVTLPSTNTVQVQPSLMSMLSPSLGVFWSRFIRSHGSRAVQNKRN